ncbi:MAG: site-specific integrase [Bacteroidetes bacterium]|nr:site-specific integrase [Bacteroidota bacterium]
MKPFLSLRSNGIWYIVWENEDGKRVWTTTRTREREEAERRLAAHQTDIVDREGQHLLTLFTREILQHTGSSLKRKTMLLYRDALRALLHEVGDVPIESITVRDIDLYKAARLDYVKAITVNKELSTLKAAFNQAVRWGYIQKNPFIGIRKLRIAERMPAYFSRQELQTLIDGVRDEWIHDIIVVGVNTGMRSGELIHLTWDAVDLNRKIVRVANGDRFETKTGRGRVIPLNETAMSILTSRRPLNERWCFTIEGRPIRQNRLSHVFKKMVRRFDLREEFHFHSLRHTFASWLVQDGVSLYQVGRLLGHSDTKTTEIYAHLQPETMHDIVDRLNL